MFIDEIDIPEGVEQIGYDAFEEMHRASLHWKKLHPISTTKNV